MWTCIWKRICIHIKIFPALFRLSKAQKTKEKIRLIIPRTLIFLGFQFEFSRNFLIHTLEFSIQFETGKSRTGKVREKFKFPVSITVSCIIFCDFLQYGTPSNGHVSHIGGVTPFWFFSHLHFNMPFILTAAAVAYWTCVLG